MPRFNFLQAALPPNTRYSLRLIKKQQRGDKQHDLVHNKLYDSIELLNSAIDTYLIEDWNIYYATAGFGTAFNAATSNAISKREFYIDVDCGETKPYLSKIDGLIALRKFTKSIGLPKPTIIDSGNGLHVHWFLDTPISIDEWQEVATALKERCEELSFNVDGVCTADIVRVLRVPGTINFKGGNTVQLLTPITHYAFDIIKAIIGKSKNDIFQRAKKITKNASVSETVYINDPNRSSKFQTIWTKSINNIGCEQIAWAIKNSETISEPQWRGVLSIAQFCEDRDWAIHEISKNYANYDPKETEYKASHIQGPYTCETFQHLGKSELCNKCIHLNTIKSPIQLCSKINATKSKDNELCIEQENGDTKKYKIPSYPYPFFRGEHGGIYIKTSSINKETGATAQKDAIVYCHDLYAFDRQRHAEFGDIVWMRHHLPNDGVREFMIAQSDIGAKDRLRDAVSKQGVTLFTTAQLANLQYFLAKQIEDLQLKAKADAMHTRFGWTTYGTFIIGNREYTPEGVKIVPTAYIIEEYVQWFKPKGTLEQWKLIAATYEQPEYDLHAVGLLAGFGSPLMHISPENGGVINYYSKKSGTGKTTILKMANSIYGDPRMLMKDARDTKLSKVHRMGVLNGIISCTDEMTNLHPEELSELLYGSTQGRARDRMQSGINAERINKITWKLISLWSSNSSVEDRLSTYKIDPQGEMARLLEIPLRTPVPNNVLESQKLFTSLNDNYGHAGDLYMNYIVPNMPDVIRLWNAMRERIYAMREWTQTERYKINQIVCIGTAGIITNSLGLTNYKINRIIKRLVELVHVTAEELRKSAVSAVESISSFLNLNFSHILIISSQARRGNIQEAPIREPFGPLHIRYEPDIDNLFIVQKDFDRWCAESFINAKELRVLFLTETGKRLDIVKKRMTKGWRIDSGPVSAYKISNASTTLGLEDMNGLSADTRNINN